MLTYEQFVDFLNNLKSGVLHLEFERYADEATGLLGLLSVQKSGSSLFTTQGTMNARNFAMAVVSYAYPADVGNYLEKIEEIRHLKQFQGVVTYQEFEVQLASYCPISQILFTASLSPSITIEFQQGARLLGRYCTLYQTLFKARKCRSGILQESRACDCGCRAYSTSGTNTLFIHTIRALTTSMYSVGCDIPCV